MNRMFVLWAAAAALALALLTALVVKNLPSAPQEEVRNRVAIITVDKQINLDIKLNAGDTTIEFGTGLKKRQLETISCFDWAHCGKVAVVLNLGRDLAEEELLWFTSDNPNIAAVMIEKLPDNRKKGDGRWGGTITGLEPGVAEICAVILNEKSHMEKTSCLRVWVKSSFSARLSGGHKSVRLFF
jgi:hypothetical protein